MPAIYLAQLKIQAARLAEKFGEPDVFLHDLNELLDFYSNRTIRASQVAQQLSVPTYRIPQAVLRQIKSELAVLAQNRTSEAATLTLSLWEAGTLESRLLAAHILGNIPSSQAIPVLSRLPDWLNQSTDKEIRTALLTDALARVRRENPETFFIILERWLANPQPSIQAWGLQALIPLLKDSRFENLPAVFRILRPAILAASPATQLDLQACLEALESVSQTETMAFLREIIRDNPQPTMLRIVRRILPALTTELQEGLRNILREKTDQATTS
jgi:hypothetical protein